MSRFYSLLFFLVTISYTLFSQSTRAFQPANKNLPDDLDLGNYYALLIANENYTDDAINDLTEPVKDAEKLKSVLKLNYGFKDTSIWLLKDPSRIEILSVLESLSDKLSENDNLMIFYAGHGYYDERRNQGYWLPSDAQRKVRAAWVSNSDIRDALKGLKARHTLLISDACFSGGIFRTRNAFSDADYSVKELYKRPSRRAITSGTLNEVPDKSVFVEYLIKRLKDNKEKFITAQNIFASLQEAVVNNSPNRQLPQYGVIQEVGDEGGDFIFVNSSSSTIIKPALLSINSPIDNADIAIDGNIIGKTNSNITIDPKYFGNHQLRVIKKGYKVYVAQINLTESGQTLSVNLDQYMFGDIVINSDVPATIYVNDVVRGQTNNTKKIPELQWGDYTIRLEAEGYKPYVQKLSLNENREYIVSAAWSPITAQLKLNGSIFGNVYLDDKLIGKAPLERFDVKPGKYTLVVSKNGYESFEKEITLQSDKVNTINYTLIAKERSTALLRSLSFPGIGQFYQERKIAGTFYATSFILSVAGLVYTQLEMNKYIDAYNIAADQYVNEKIFANLAAKKLVLANKEATKNDATTLRNIAAVSAAGIYVLNALDVILFAPDFTDVNNQLSFHVQQSPNQDAILLTSSIRF